MVSLQQLMNEKQFCGQFFMLEINQNYLFFNCYLLSVLHVDFCEITITNLYCEQSY